jgi:hypothetical protein
MTREDVGGIRRKAAGRSLVDLVDLLVAPEGHEGALAVDVLDAQSRAIRVREPPLCPARSSPELQGKAASEFPPSGCSVDRDAREVEGEIESHDQGPRLVPNTPQLLRHELCPREQLQRTSGSRTVGLVLGDIVPEPFKGLRIAPGKIISIDQPFLKAHECPALPLAMLVAAEEQALSGIGRRLGIEDQDVLRPPDFRFDCAAIQLPPYPPLCVRADSHHE